MRRTAMIAAIVVGVASAAMAQVGGQNKVRYDTFEWQIYKTPHFEIHHYDRVVPTLERIASYAESSYDELARRLNFQILEPVTMLAYASHAEFQQNNVIVGFIPEGAGAFATPVRNRMVLPVDMTDEQLQALIQHELTHIFQYEILFQGWRGRAIYRRPPTWFMEGMASYFADDEDSRAEAYMRDAALAERVPSVMQGVEGYFAYRFGHKVFEFIESEWGEDGVRDFVFAFRGGFGTNPSGPIRRTFNMSPDEFDARFRAWLRRLYQPYADRGLPEEFGRRFSTGDQSAEASPAASPSGDLIAAFSTYKQDVDVVVFGVPDRRLYKNLTKGLTTEYDYLVAQHLTVGGEEGGGGDLAVSPDGNVVAVFARTDRNRSLLLLDAARGGILRTIEIPLPMDQPMSPAFSPDGGTVAFRAIQGGRFDIYLLDLGSEEITNLTNDVVSDSAPVFSPDGEHLVYTAQLGEHGKLVRISLTDPDRREQLTFGPGTDEAPALSPDGKRVYFASDREDGVLDIYVYDTETLQLSRVTHVMGAAINPVPISTLEGERVVFQGFGRGSWDLYVADPNLAVPVQTAPPPSGEIELDEFVPAVTIPINLEENVIPPKRSFYIEDAGAFVGVDQNSDLISSSFLSLSDQYGDRRIVVALQTVQSYSIFDATYLNLEKRLQWGGTVFDRRSYFLTQYNPVEDVFREREQVYRETGGQVIGIYPLSRYYRLEGALGYVDRNSQVPVAFGAGSGVVFSPSGNQVPFVEGAVVGDTTFYRRHGPHKGTRWRLGLGYAPDIEEGGTLYTNVNMEGRLYVPLTRRSELALRLYGAYSDGNAPTIYAFGGFDSFRGVPARSVPGNRVVFSNIEWRFPLIDYLGMPFLQLANVRGRLFVDVGAGWYVLDGEKYNYLGLPGFDFMEDGRLKDGLSSYGFGFSFNLLGIPMHFDYSKFWDFEDTISDKWEVDFWLGWQF